METSLIGKALNFGFNEYGFKSRVSNIYSGLELVNIFNMLKLNNSKKKLKFRLVYTKKNFEYIKVLKFLSLFNKYTITKIDNILYINIHIYYYKNFFIGKNIKHISTSSKKIFISLHALILISKKSGNSSYLISTTYGILPH